MPLFAASLESLIVFVVILALSALGNWLKTRKGQATEGWGDEEGPTVPPRKPGQPAPGPTQPPASQPGPAFDLERELRRMFGQEPEPPPPPTRPSPPVLAPSPVPPMARPPARPSPVLADDIEEEFVPVSLPSGTHFPKTARAMDQASAPDFELAPLAQSKAAYHRASSLEMSVQAKLEAVRLGLSHAMPPRSGHPKATSPELASVLHSLKQPRTARQAILASVILGPPRSLER
jgi:hypothetical protein